MTSLPGSAVPRTTSAMDSRHLAREIDLKLGRLGVLHDGEAAHGPGGHRRARIALTRQ
jgi:hypothetical protein